jgi:hypothetical protein
MGNASSTRPQRTRRWTPPSRLSDSPHPHTPTLHTFRRPPRLLPAPTNSASLPPSSESRLGVEHESRTSAGVAPSDGPSSGLHSPIAPPSSKFGFIDCLAPRVPRKSGLFGRCSNWRSISSPVLAQMAVQTAGDTPMPPREPPWCHPHKFARRLPWSGPGDSKRCSSLVRRRTAPTWPASSAAQERG